MAKVFVLEDDPDRIRWLCERLRSHEWHCVHTCHRDYEFKGPYDVILLDHDLGGRQMDNTHEDNGLSFLVAIKDQIGETPVIIHSYNGPAADRMKREWPAALIAPFRGPTFNVLVDRLIGPEQKWG